MNARVWYERSLSCARIANTTFHSFVSHTWACYICMKFHPPNFFFFFFFFLVSEQETLLYVPVVISKLRQV